MSDIAADRVKVAKALMDFAVEVAAKNKAHPHIGIFVANTLPAGTIMAACANILQMNYALFGDNYGTGPCLIQVVGAESSESIAKSIAILDDDAVMPVQHGSIIVIRTDGNDKNVKNYARMLDLQLFDHLDQEVIEYTVQSYD